jgi:Uma2 family endonuclease
MSGTTNPAQARSITGEELQHMSDLGPCELIDGRIVPMSPASDEHGRIEVNFAVALKQFVKDRGLGLVVGGEVGIFTQGNPDRVRAADVAYISHERHARRGRSAGFLDVAPELVVEILSPTDSAGDLTQKLREYFAAGVRLVWVADPATRSVLAYRSITDVRELRDADRLTGEDVLPGFEVAVAALFDE